MLHTKGPLIDPSRVSRALTTLQSSSPSYLLLASLDAARLHAQDPAVWAEPLAAAAVARTGLGLVLGVYVLGEHSGVPAATSSDAVASDLGAGTPRASGANASGAAAATAIPASTATSATSATYSTNHPAASAPSIAAFDPLRLTVCVSGLGISGFQAASALEAGPHHIVPELATQHTVMLAMGPGTCLAHAHALVAAFRDLAGQQKQLRLVQQQQNQPPSQQTVAGTTEQCPEGSAQQPAGPGCRCASDGKCRRGEDPAAGLEAIGGGRARTRR